MGLCEDIRFLTGRALWEMENLMRCIPDALWNKRYDEIPMWKYVYHTLYSLDRWFINPCDPTYRDPDFHTPQMADLNAVPGGACLSRTQLETYFKTIETKIETYCVSLEDDQLVQTPPGCTMTRFCLILGQYRHWHRHMGLIYGFIVEDTGKWPYVLNMQGVYPETPMPNYYP